MDPYVPAKSQRISDEPTDENLYNMDTVYGVGMNTAQRS
jgi:hypothetical protein